ncbi:alpha/beta-hydrolase [Hanseniaspora valbyensis NRRL Y-1626]|uniref:Alpha/beta-hydrolase n=1 Tax=Hanseniaspora valbyensis NRRL Y-1626 TaxID=766949 RepID=A0A1B7TK34_9ASCO|nr:alpha/beta-hydrolase [Hanseniaspora valbyensis NRRL Y-1626]
MLFPSKSFHIQRSFQRFVTNYSTLPIKTHIDMKYDLYLPHKSTIQKLPYHCQESIIFMHGILGNRKLYKNDCQILANYLNTAVYAVDMRNHGETENCLPLDYKTLSDDIYHFASDHGLEKPSLIGYSLGAKIAMLAILQNPSNFTSVVCVDNVPIPQPEIIPFLTAFTKSIGTLITESNITKFDKDWVHNAALWMMKYVPDKPTIDYMIKNVTNKSSHIKQLFCVPEKNSLYCKVPVLAISDIINSEVPAWPSDLVEGCKVDNSILFIKASRSGFIEEKGVNAIKKYFNNYDIIELQGTHLIMFERPQAYISAVANWFIKRNKTETSQLADKQLENNF